MKYSHSEQDGALFKHETVGYHSWFVTLFDISNEISIHTLFTHNLTHEHGIFHYNKHSVLHLELQYVGWMARL